MAFSRYAGLRIPSEIRHLKFTDFVTEMNGDVSFDISPHGKTGERVVPLFDELRPYYEALVNERKEGQEYIFAKYRNCTNVGTLIKKRMAKSGAAVWQKFFVNCRRSCITDKLYAGWSEFDLTAVFGNTEDVRREYYYFQRKRSDVAALGRSSGGTAVGSSTAAVVPAENCATVCATLSTNLGSFWEKFDDETPAAEVMYELLIRHGWSTKMARVIADKGRDTETFVNVVRAYRQAVCDYYERKISYASMLISVAAALCRSLWGRLCGSPLFKIMWNENFGQNYDSNSPRRDSNHPRQTL